MKRAVVIGSGWGAHAARALAAHPGVVLDAIIGRGSERSRALAVELDVPLRTEVDPDVDLAVLCVGERHHYALAAPLLERGVDMLIAHPICSAASDVEDLERIASKSGALVRTDYTLRLRPELTALRPRPERGELLRVSIEAPGRWLPIALDVAVQLAGPVQVVHSHGAYPHRLTERVRKAPHVFVPTVTLTHVSGTVSTLVPVPHAAPAEPIRVCASFEAGRLVASLPRGGARSLSLGPNGRVIEAALVTVSAEPLDATVHGGGMQALVAQFATGVCEGGLGLATLAEEVHLRHVWAAVWRATRRRDGADVEATPDGHAE